MGNCQAVDAAALVIQHPNGKQERMYWSVTASEVMKMNPGYYVSLIIPLPIPDDAPQENSDDKKIMRFTRVKLLRPTDTLVLGRAYRLVTAQEVVKVLRAKKQAKMKKNQPESGENLQMISKMQSTGCGNEAAKPEPEKQNKATIPDRHHHQGSGSTNFAPGRHKSWRPSLQSISESIN